MAIRPGGLIQNTTAATTLAGFERPVPVVIINIAQDWKRRQKIQYEAMKGLMRDDFHSLPDFTAQMDILMSSGSIGQKIAWRTLKPTVKLQGRLMARLLPDPQMGLVGRYLRMLVGFTLMFFNPNEILKGKFKLR